MELIRCFIAIELPEELKVRLKQLEDQLKSARQSDIKWVDPYSIHLTLKFLGDVAAGKIAEITEAMQEAVKGMPPFCLETRELGAFPNLRRVQVVWLGIGGELDKLNQLQKSIETNLEIIGFAPEARAFTAHLTLARFREHASFGERQAFAEALTKTKFEPVCPFTVESIRVMKSQLTPQGAIYSRIGSVALNKPLSTASL